VTTRKGNTTKVGVTTLLAEARALGVERLDAMALISHHSRRERTWLLAHDDEPLDSAMIDTVRSSLHRRSGGVPLAYLVGHKEFHGLSLSVNPSVLIPRPETECLVDGALAWLAARDDAAPVIVDLGTGSGAIALALKHRHPRTLVHGVDQSPAALETAHANARALGLEVSWHLGDWWRGGWLDDVTSQDGAITLVVGNPPYIADGDPHLTALRHEPAEALVSGPDGMDAIRMIVGGAAAHLRPGLALMLEHGHDQGVAVRQLLACSGFGSVATQPDLAGIPRWTMGIRD
jgi:release factor glutamine methyltransferase